MSVDSTLAIVLRTHLLSYLINAFQSLDNGLVRKECASLVSISIWHNLDSAYAREKRFEQHGPLRKAWRAAIKRYEAADKTSQARLRFERGWLYTMILDFMSRLSYSTAGKLNEFADERLVLMLIQMKESIVSDSLNFLRILKVNYQRDDMSIP